MRFLLPALLFVSGSAIAFPSYPKGGPHDRITRRAAEATELHSSAESELKQAVREIDLVELAMDLRAAGNPRLLRGPAAAALLQPRCGFDGSHHFERTEDEKVDAVLRQGRGVLKRARAEALSALEDGDRAGAIEAMGLGLHVIQDFFAHSNIVFLDEASAPLVAEWLLGSHELPANTGIEVIVYEPCAVPVGEGELQTSSAEAAESCGASFSAFCMAVASPKSFAGAQRDVFGTTAHNRAVGVASDASIRWMRALKLEAGAGWSVLQ
ncbi:MAG: hypothetical protein KC912_12670 [Proteobacteria bacterium]|nr:hypothetical protein [Pseudomonadota bacterium]